MKLCNEERLGERSPSKIVELPGAWIFLTLEPRQETTPAAFSKGVHPYMSFASAPLLWAAGKAQPVRDSVIKVIPEMAWRCWRSTPASALVHSGEPPGSCGTSALRTSRAPRVFLTMLTPSMDGS